MSAALPPQQTLPQLLRELGAVYDPQARTLDLSLAMANRLRIHASHAALEAKPAGPTVCQAYAARMPIQGMFLSQALRLVATDATLRQASTYAKRNAPRSMETYQSLFAEYWRLVFGCLEVREQYRKGWYAIMYLMPYTGYHKFTKEPTCVRLPDKDMGILGQRLCPTPRGERTTAETFVWMWMFECLPSELLGTRDETRRNWIPVMNKSPLELTDAVRVGVPLAAMKMYRKYADVLETTTVAKLKTKYKTTRSHLRKRMAQLRYLERTWQAHQRDYAHFKGLQAHLYQCMGEPGLVDHIGAFLHPTNARQQELQQIHLRKRKATRDALAAAPVQQRRV